MYVSPEKARAVPDLGSWNIFGEQSRFAPAESLLSEQTNNSSAPLFEALTQAPTIVNWLPLAIQNISC